MRYLSRGAKDLVARAAPLTFGIFATVGDRERRAREGGSGIFVAPFLAITARHVTDDLYRVADREAPHWLHLSEHAGHLFQVLDPLNPGTSSKAFWRVNRSWTSPLTDMALLQVSAESETAKALQENMPKFFEWHLCSPPVGATVWAIGYPRHSVTPADKGVDIGAPFTVHELRVTEISPLYRDRGMLNFPCFEVDASVEHGFSGGPVFYEGKLCGTISSGSGFDERSYVALLWPLTLMDYSNELKQLTRFGDLLDRGVVVSDCWQELRTRISKGEDEFGNPRVFIEPSRTE